jgi:transposase InsO family protein
MENAKQQFILLYQTGKFTKTELCRHFNISRPTGDAILKRYTTEGWDALEPKNRCHKSHPATTPQHIEETIIELRKKYIHWGARKIRVLMHRDLKLDPSLIPSETTVNSIMKKHGLTKIRRLRRRHLKDQFPIFDPTSPNEIWSADFKGKFKMGNRQYCQPLTIADSKTRFLVAIQALERATIEASKPIFDKAFHEWGLPEYIHTDNGSPFGNALSLRRMTHLSVWFMDLGITPVYSDPAHPEQNGRHERMHRDLKAAATRPPGKDLSAQQRKFNQFRTEYNQVRPHEALNMETPSAIHIHSPRTYLRRVEEWQYDSAYQTRYVTVNGSIRWKSDTQVMISTALGGKYIGMEELENGVWGVWYRHILLGYYSERTRRMYEVEEFNL